MLSLFHMEDTSAGPCCLAEHFPGDVEHVQSIFHSVRLSRYWLVDTHTKDAHASTPMHTELPKTFEGRVTRRFSVLTKHPIVLISQSCISFGPTFGVLCWRCMEEIPGGNGSAAGPDSLHESEVRSTARTSWHSLLLCMFLTNLKHHKGLAPSNMPCAHSSVQFDWHSPIRPTTGAHLPSHVRANSPWAHARGMKRSWRVVQTFVM